MKKAKIFILLAMLASAGCASQNTADGSAANSAAGTSNRPPAEAPADGETAGTTPANGADAGPVAAMKNARLQELRKGSSTSVSTTDVDVKAPTRPAPENSEYSVTLGKTAVEVRTFRDNPSISKVEKINDGKKSVVKIYLKTGKVVELPGARIDNLGSISSSEILAAASVAKRPPPSAELLNETKKPSN